MRLEFHDRLGKPTQAQATRVVIYDDLGNPIALALSPGDGSVIASTAEHHPDEFHAILRSFGIGQTVLVKTLQPRPLADLTFKDGVGS